MDVKVNRNAPILFHDQVAAQIRRAIADDEAKPASASPRHATSPP